MATVFLSPVFNNFQAFDDNGLVISGALLNTYQSNTITPLATYQDKFGTVANTNPIVSDSSGRFPPIWLLQGNVYDFVLTDANLVVLNSQEKGISGVGDGVSLVLPLTTKGDLLTESGSGLVRLPVGSDGQILTANSAATDGINWSNPVANVTSFNTRTGAVTLTSTDVTNALGYVPVLSFNTRTGAVTLTATDVATAQGLIKGSIFVGTGANTGSALPVGTNGYILTADSTQTTGIKWAASGSAGTVTSVGVSGNNGIGVVGSPITGAGTITLSLGAITPTSVASTGTVGGTNLSGTNTGDQTITLLGDVTGSGTGSFAATLSITGVSPGTYTNSTITVDAKGRISSASSGASAGVSSFEGRIGAVTLQASDVATAESLVKGAIFVGTGSNVGSTQAIGPDTYVLTADSTQTTGMKWAAGNTGTVTSVSGSGGTTGLSLTGGPISTVGTLTLGGVLAVTNGGTGATNIADIFNNISPITSVGDLIVGTGVDTAGRLAIGTSGYVLTSNGTTATWQASGTGTVTSVSVVTANGVSGTVANATTTPAITLTLGAITPSSVAATGTVTGSNLSGTNTGNQTITLTGDVTGTGTGSFATTLATVNSNVGTFNSVTVNGKGLVTAASNVSFVSSFNTRTGAVTLSSSDVTTALGYTPVNKAGDSMSGTLTMDGVHTVTGIPTPVNPSDAANKGYVDSAIEGLDVKPSAICGTTTGLPAYTYLSNVITATSTGVLTIDGHTVAANDIILVKNETSTNQPYNGLYVCTVAGAVGVAYVLTRHSDMNSSTEFSGSFVFVETGTVNAATGWYCTDIGSVVVGTTNITFVQFSGSGTYTAGTGLTLTGNVFSLNIPVSEATNSDNTLVTTTTTNANYPLVLAPTSSTGQQSLLTDIDVTYNPFTDVLTLPSTGYVSAGAIQAATYLIIGVSTISSAGASQGTATAITTSQVNVSSGATNTGVILPSSTLGSIVGNTIWITNDTGNTIYVYPNSGGTIDGAATNAPLTMGGGQTVACTLFSANTWYTTSNLLYGGTGIALSHGIGGISINLNTPVSIANGGTNATSASAAFNNLSPITSTGDLIIGNGSNSATRLAIGSNTYVLTSNGTTASWVAPATSGTVTSVGLSDGSTSPIYTISGSPVSSSGTLTFTLKSQTQNLFFASPNGSSGQPTFRSIVAADVPTLNQNTTGTSANVTGTVAILNGGTGQTTATNAINALLPSQTGQSGNFLTTNGTNTSWSAQLGGAPINAQSGTTYTFVIGDAGYLCTFSNASPITVTVPPNSSVAFPVNTQIEVLQAGAGSVTFSPGAGVTIDSLNGALSLAGQYAGAVLIKSATNTWYLAGLSQQVSTFSAGTTGFTPNTATTGAVTLSGTLAIANGGTGATLSQTAANALTNRTNTITSSSTPTPVADTTDTFTVTALATGATFGVPTYTTTPVDGQDLLIRIKDNGSAQTLGWNAIYRAIGVTLPTTTVISKTLYVAMFYNVADTKWDVVGVAQQA